MTTITENKAVNMTNDDFAKFMFNIGLKEVNNYNFDVCHDIAKVVNWAYNDNNYRNEYGELITREAVSKEYILHIRTTGTYLVESHNYDMLASLDRAFDHHLKYKVVITANCGYLYNIPFAVVTKLK